MTCPTSDADSANIISATTATGLILPVTSNRWCECCQGEHCQIPRGLKRTVVSVSNQCTAAMTVKNAVFASVMTAF